MVLHGHRHEMKEYFREGIRFVNAGGSVDNKKEEASLFLIDAFPFEISAKISPLSKISRVKEVEEKMVVSLASC